jgi:hypothetical protein
MIVFSTTEAAGMALRLTFGNLAASLRIALPWLLVLAVTPVILTLLFPGYRIVPQFPDFSTLATNPAPAGNSWLADLTYFVVSVIAASSIAVCWQRYLLLDSDGSEDFLRLDWPVWRYIGNVLLLNLLIFGAAFLVGLVGGFVTAIFAAVVGAIPALIVSAVIGIFVLSWIVLAAYRLGVKLPAVAIGIEGYGFREAWADTRERGLRLLGFSLICGVVFLGILLLGMLVVFGAITVFGMSSVLTAAVAVAASVAIVWLIAVFNASCMAVLYAILAEGREI